ncbi:Coiled-coil domain-containing protein 12 [Coemansia sp. RSA 720]|nr:Coiled-coil domain-containing protein 12 [Coemansia sp. RSA 638]KAJ2123046.1 Coiled-coil domain-containing protein 12 [Coemansia sp. RSA 720]
MNSLEEESLKRKDRLQALRNAWQHPDQPHSPEVLRNYSAVLAKESLSLQPNTQDTLESSVTGIVEKAIDDRKHAAETMELDITSIAPRRPNWDLKRELNKRLDELKLQNEIAVADIIRKRIQLSKNIQDIASAVTAHSKD